MGISLGKIAQQLHLSKATVQYIVKNKYDKVKKKENSPKNGSKMKY